jgi:hypothetical protein
VNSLQRPSRVSKLGWVFFVPLFALAGSLFEPLCAQTPTLIPKPVDDSNFHFSIYFTGNARGNLEPCG